MKYGLGITFPPYISSKWLTKFNKNKKWVAQKSCKIVSFDIILVQNYADDSWSLHSSSNENDKI
jgi:hypothetical protein